MCELAVLKNLQAQADAAKLAQQVEALLSGPRPANEKDADRVVRHLADLWGYEVVLSEVDGESGSALKEHKARPRADEVTSPL